MQSSKVILYILLKTLLLALSSLNKWYYWSNTD